MVFNPAKLFFYFNIIRFTKRAVYSGNLLLPALFSEALFNSKANKLNHDVIKEKPC